MRLALSLLAVPVLAQNVNFFTIEKEKALGRQCALEVKKHSKPLANPGIAGYVNRIGQELVGQLKARRLDYSFEAIQGTEWTEPLVLPGGYIFVPARAFATARSEAEFATLIAHSIGHVELRHGTRTATRGQVENLPSTPLMFIGGWMGLHVESQPGAKSLVPAGFLKIQREYELEADRFGVELAARAGYESRVDSSGEEFRRAQETVRQLLETTTEPRAPTLRR
jgi:predicted Zn-dependent protease